MRGAVVVTTQSPVVLALAIDQVDQKGPQRARKVVDERIEVVDEPYRADAEILERGQTGRARESGEGEQVVPPLPGADREGAQVAEVGEAVERNAVTAGRARREREGDVGGAGQGSDGRGRQGVAGAREVRKYGWRRGLVAAPKKERPDARAP